MGAKGKDQLGSWDRDCHRSAKAPLGDPSVVCPWSKPSPLSINLHCGVLPESTALWLQYDDQYPVQPWTPVSTNPTWDRISRSGRSSGSPAIQSNDFPLANPASGVISGSSTCPSENYPLSRTASRTLVILSIVSILLCGVSRTFLEFN